MKLLETLRSGLWRRVANIRAMIIPTACWICLCLNSSATARETHEAHVHGVASLTVASVEGALEMQFESPAMSILGFEHTPTNRAQLDTVANSRARLESPKNVFAIDGAKCKPSVVSVEVFGPAGKGLEHANEHGHKSTKERHSEISATYVFDCDVSQVLSSVRVLLFEQFPALEKINVNWITDSQQGQLVLKRGSPAIEFP